NHYTPSSPCPHRALARSFSLHLLFCSVPPPSRLLLSLPRSGPPPPLPSFPTRRSSDLWRPRPRPRSHCSQHCTRWTSPSSGMGEDRKSTRLNSSHVSISYAVFCLKKKIVAARSQDGHSESIPADKQETIRQAQVPWRHP